MGIYLAKELSVGTGDDVAFSIDIDKNGNLYLVDFPNHLI